MQGSTYNPVRGDSPERPSHAGAGAGAGAGVGVGDMEIEMGGMHTGLDLNLDDGERLRIPSLGDDVDSLEDMVVGQDIERKSLTDGKPVSKPIREPEDLMADGFCAYCCNTFKLIWLGSKMNILLLLTPFAMWSNSHDYKAMTFVLALLALCPFAERISFVTEDVAKYTNDTLGGLLNASFGNITELIVCIFALKAGLLRLVQVSMLGSVLSNLLLVLGSAFIVGGSKHKEQTYSATASITNSGLLMMSVLALTMPAILSATNDGAGGHHQVMTTSGDGVGDGGDGAGDGGVSVVYVDGGESPIALSRFVAVLMLAMYGLLLYFQLCTHTFIFEGAEEDDDEPGELGLWGGIFWLAFITLFISILSDYIVDAIEGAAEDLGVPILFLSGILVPIVGNAAEHAAAIIFAYRNKMEISLGIAVGSSIQIVLFVVPLCVVVGWAMGQPMSLDFHAFETTALVLSCIMVRATYNV